MTAANCLTVAASLDSLHEVRDFLTSTGGRLEIDPAVVSDLHLAVDEALTNIIMHGFRGRPGNIYIDVAREDDVVVVRLRDDAPLFDPTTTTRPDLHVSPLERKSAGGYGVELVRHMVDDLRYRAIDQHNELSLVKKL